MSPLRQTPGRSENHAVITPSGANHTCGHTICRQRRYEPRRIGPSPGLQLVPRGARLRAVPFRPPRRSAACSRTAQASCGWPTLCTYSRGIVDDISRGRKGKFWPLIGTVKLSSTLACNQRAACSITTLVTSAASELHSSFQLPCRDCPRLGVGLKGARRRIASWTSSSAPPALMQSSSCLLVAAPSSPRSAIG